MQIPMRATVRQRGRSAHLPTEAANSMRSCSDTYLSTDVLRTSKILRDFQILVGNLKNTNGHYRQNLMPPPKKILFYVSSVTLQCKTSPPPPLVVHFFSILLIHLLFSSCKSFVFLIVFLLF